MGKNRVEAELTHFSNLYQCIVEREQDKVHNRKTAFIFVNDMVPSDIGRNRGNFAVEAERDIRKIPIVVVRTTKRRNCEPVSLASKHVSR